jgi:hypothetical protein
MDEGALPQTNVHAVVPDDHPHKGELLQSLRLLRDAHFVEVVGEDPAADTAGWSLTERCVSNMVVGNILSDPTPVMRPRLSAPVAQWSHFELMSFLHQKQWQALPWEKGTRCPQALALPDDGAASSAASFLEPSQKKWYFRPFDPNISDSYLRAMVFVETHGLVMRDAGVRHIPHTAKNKYYDTLAGIALGTKALDDLPVPMVFESEGRPRSPRPRKRLCQRQPRPPPLCDHDEDRGFSEGEEEAPLALPAPGAAAQPPSPPAPAAAPVPPAPLAPAALAPRPPAPGAAEEAAADGPAPGDGDGVGAAPPSAKRARFSAADVIDL